MMSNFGGKSRTVRTVTISCLLVMVLALAIASMGSLVSARPLTRSASTTTDNYLVDEIFPKPANVQHLYNAITGKTNATYADVMSAATAVTNAADIRNFNAGNDIKVTFGGFVWDVVYLSTTKDNRPILTLYLQDPLPKSQWNKWGLNASIKYFSSMYGTSYIRALINNGGQYAADSENLLEYEAKENYILQDFLPDGRYADLIVTPSNVQWQENGEFFKDIGYSRHNDLLNENWGGDGYFTYFDFSEHENYADWKDDNLWLPSATEVTRRFGDTSLFRLSTAQYGGTSWSRSSDDTYASWAALNLGTSTAVTTEYDVRPALHLDLAALNQKATADLPDITVTYDGSDQQVANMSTQPEWYSENLPISYTKGGKAETAIKTVGEYIAKVELPILTNNFKITVTPRPITYVGELSVVEKTYDATTKATVTDATTFDDVIENDDVRLSINANFLTKDVGSNKTVVANISLTGKDATNYTLTNAGKKELFGKINVCTVVVNNIKAVDKEYDNTDKAPLNLAESYLSLTGDLMNDDVTIAATGKFRQKTIGQNLIVDLDVKLDGADAHNYVIGGNTQVLCYADIVQRAITIKINKVRSPINDDLAELTATVQSGSLATGDTMNDVITLSTDADYAALGEYTITGAGINPNYKVSIVNDGIYEIYDPALEPDPETTTTNTKDNNIWLVIFCAGGVTAIVLILIILIAIIKHQHRIANEKLRQQKATAKNKDN